MHLLPIHQTPAENQTLLNNPLCKDTVEVCMEYYKTIGYNPPWICYFVEEDGEIIGNAGYKGKPVNNTIEIAYGTVPKHQNKGIGTRICRLLVETALQADPFVTITARTLPETNYSNRLLRKNGFVFTGVVNDPDDGDVWEWRYIANLIA